MLPDSLLTSQIIFCEKVLKENDGIHSIIRRADIFFVSGGAENDLRASRIGLLATGRFEGSDGGSYLVTIELVRPDGDSGKMAELTIDLSKLATNPASAVRGFDITVEMNIAPVRYGRYWVRMLLDGECASKAWFELVDTAQVSQGQ